MTERKETTRLHPESDAADCRYEAPKLTVHGSVEELTRGIGNGDADVGYGSQPWT